MRSFYFCLRRPYSQLLELRTRTNFSTVPASAEFFLNVWLLESSLLVWALQINALAPASLSVKKGNFEGKLASSSLDTNLDSVL